MTELSERFENASKAVNELTKKPSNDELLQLYALYKQSTKGDVGGVKPNIFDLVGRAKFEAWEKLKGTSSEQAQEEYSKLVESLLAKE